MANTQSSHEQSIEEEPAAPVSKQSPEESKPDDDEFKITIKKLDTVVRPRGVLADG